MNNISSDSISQRQNVRENWEAETTLALGLDIAGIGLGWIDYFADTITLDERAAGFFGLEQDIPISREKIHNLIHQDDRALVIDKVEGVLAREESGFVDLIHRVNHPVKGVSWLRARKHIKFQVNDKTPIGPRSGLVAIMDVTSLKSSEERLKLLMGETAHRSKNLLTVVQGIARMTERSGPLESFVERFTARLTALSANHDVVVDGLSETVNLRDLVEAQIRPFKAENKDRISLKGQTLILSPETGQAIAMAIHELLTNAMKYGALKTAEGRVEIIWDVDKGADTYEIRWTEIGGAKITKPDTKGFGTRVIKDMTQSATGGHVKYEFEPDGVTWRINGSLDYTA